MFQARHPNFVTNAILVIASALVWAAPAHAANTCQDLFRPQTTRGKIAAEVANLARRLSAPRFDIRRFDEALSEYKHNGIEAVGRPRTREARVAYLQYVVGETGNNPYNLEREIEAASPKQRRAIVAAVGRFNADKGFTPEKIDAIYWRLFSYAASNPNTIMNIKRLGIQEMDRVALEQWTTKELASNNAVDAFEKLGLLKEPGLRDRWMSWMRSHPHVTTNITIGAMMVFEKSLLGIPVTLPMYSRMRVTKLDPELRQLVEEKGFDAAYPFLKAHYGNSIRFDRSFYFARRAATVALMTYFVVNLYPGFVREILPPNLTNNDMNAVQVTEVAAKYYGELIYAVAEDHLHGTDQHEIDTRMSAIPAPAKPHAKLAAAGTVRVLPQVVDKVSANRLEVTFNQQIAKPKHTKPVAVPKTDLGDDDQNNKALDDNLGYLNSLDFSAPTSR